MEWRGATTEKYWNWPSLCQVKATNESGKLKKKHAFVIKNAIFNENGGGIVDFFFEKKIELVISI